MTEEHHSYEDIVFGKTIGENEQTEPVDTSRKGRALNRAWATRGFEIELYWKRALYFWGFIALAAAGYVKGHDTRYSLIIAGIGLVFSLAWFLVNKGSKFWQENWEAHIDCLEDDLEGQLYKTVMKNRISFWNPMSSYPFSVSGINQAISFFIVLIWCGILFKELFTQTVVGLMSQVWSPVIILIGLAVVIALLLYFGRTGFMRKKPSIFKKIYNCKYEYHNREIN
ncbi:MULTISPECIES: hypothetical protein [Kordiimonas]|jgi:hypothetical protein|uniref:RipA family octameric membrane protein n=1 Tax=Kordiimonas TaxID=288021 RepID=UPI00257A85E9|nr:hypothetical protein [Kordiimonas sp. UBA4487]